MSENKRFTVVRVLWNRYNEPVGVIDLGLQPMTEKESYTFRSKMMDPSNYKVIKIIT
ncbi:hypothetical protein [Aeromonas phage AS-sw]|uniref:Uncharacterized protein n=1 Tax=Aeromonas phage AS-sw TaxID=2026113 RepID=A0A291LH37_9CAUD|nr:hypothetical protein HWB29_gp323 [Aeromonas phage AS-sw]ATI18373.1 hypothetical protein [Aeromonas phage AS-sw]